jgi:hypothetical protein
MNFKTFFVACERNYVTAMIATGSRTVDMAAKRFISA